MLSSQVMNNMNDPRLSDACLQHVIQAEGTISTGEKSGYDRCEIYRYTENSDELGTVHCPFGL